MIAQHVSERALKKKAQSMSMCILAAKLSLAMSSTRGVG
jgi:hypothetical protein